MKTSSSHPSGILGSRPSKSIEHDQAQQTNLVRGKSEWEKNALRICGSWSEQLSSKGKVYFYNSITEVSQWQKPSEWTLPDVSKKELLKMINDRPGMDTASVKRNFPALAQADRNRSRQRDVSSSPKRFKLSSDSTRNNAERLKADSNLAAHSDYLVYRKPNQSGLHNTNAHFKQLADNIRESWDNILASRSIPQASVSSCQRHFSSSRLNEERPNNRVSSSCSLPNCSALSLSHLNCVESKGSCNELRLPTPGKDQIRMPLGGENTCCKQSRSPSAANHCPPISTTKVTSSLSSGLSALAKFLTNPESQSLKSSSQRACGSNPDADSFNSKTYLNSTANQPLLSYPNRSFTTNSACFERSSLNTTSSQQSVLVSRIESLPDPHKLGSPLVYPDVATSKHLNLSATCNTRSPDQSLDAINDRVHLNNWSNSSSDYGKPSHSHTVSGGNQKQSASPGQALRSIVALLTNAVNARRDHMPTSRRTPVNPSPSNTSAKEVASIITFLNTQKKQMDVGAPAENISPGQRLPINGSTPYRSELEQGKSVEGLLGPPSSDGTSIINSPSCTKTSPHTSPNVCTTISIVAHTSHAGFMHTTAHDSCRTVSRLQNVSNVETCSYGSLISHQPDRVTVPVTNTCDSDQQLPNTSTLVLENPELQKFVDPHLTEKFQHPIADNLEIEAQRESRNFDRLHSVLYSELSGELKKLRALVGISETKLKINQKRKEALQDLMDALEIRRTVPSFLSSDSVL